MFATRIPRCSFIPHHGNHRKQHPAYKTWAFLPRPRVARLVFYAELAAASFWLISLHIRWQPWKATIFLPIIFAIKWENKSPKQLITGRLPWVMPVCRVQSYFAFAIGPPTKSSVNRPLTNFNAPNISHRPSLLVKEKCVICKKHIPQSQQ